MKKFFLTAVLALLLHYPAIAQSRSESDKTIKIAIDLNSVKDDKVMVSVQAPSITSNNIVYRIPKIIPGTYSEDNYGKFIEDFTATDKKRQGVDSYKGR